MIIARRALNDLVAHAQAARPHECCGILIGRSSTIEHAVPCKNLRESSTRFLLDPRDHIEARRQARAWGAEVVGFYHSHPHSAAIPSPTDVAEAAYPDCVSVIVSLAGPDPDTRAFRIGAGAIVEETLEVA